MPDANLSRVSDKELLTSLNRLVRDERARTVQVLEHLNEIERRELHLKLGYSSLFDYCVSRLKYSRSAAGRRIATARALRRFPEIGSMLVSGEVSLMTVSLIARILTPENKTNLLTRIKDRSQREVERILSEHKPETAIRDRVRAVCVKVLEDPTPSAGSDTTALGGRELDCENGKAPEAVPPSASRSQPETPENAPDVELRVHVVHKHVIQFAAGDDFMRRLEEVRVLLSNKMPGLSFEQVFDATMKAYLYANCPKRREQRRERRRAKHLEARREENRDARATTGKSRDNFESLPALGVAPPRTKSMGPKGDGSARTRPSRHIPVAVRDAVFARDNGRCAYVGPTGRRCKSNHNIQIDHIQPFARGGAHTISNLRLLCSQHNRLMAEAHFGEAKMAEYPRRE